MNGFEFDAKRFWKKVDPSETSKSTSSELCRDALHHDHRQRVEMPLQIQRFCLGRWVFHVLIFSWDVSAFHQPKL